MISPRSCISSRMTWNRNIATTFASSKPIRVQQALNQLKQMSLHNEPVALLLVDEQMPEMNGSEFLKEARALYPQAKRILLITYADTHAAIQAINSRAN